MWDVNPPPPPSSYLFFRGLHWGPRHTTPSRWQGEMGVIIDIENFFKSTATQFLAVFKQTHPTPIYPPPPNPLYPPPPLPYLPPPYPTYPSLPPTYPPYPPLLLTLLTLLFSTGTHVLHTEDSEQLSKQSALWPLPSTPCLYTADLQCRGASPGPHSGNDADKAPLTLGGIQLYCQPILRYTTLDFAHIYWWNIHTSFHNLFTPGSMEDATVGLQWAYSTPRGPVLGMVREGRGRCGRVVGEPQKLSVRYLFIGL